MSALRSPDPPRPMVARWGWPAGKSAPFADREKERQALCQWASVRPIVEVISSINGFMLGFCRSRHGGCEHKDSPLPLAIGVRHPEGGGSLPNRG